MRNGRGQAVAVAAVAPKDLAAAGTRAVATQREDNGIAGAGLRAGVSG